MLASYVGVCVIISGGGGVSETLKGSGATPSGLTSSQLPKPVPLSPSPSSPASHRTLVTDK